ncbi:MAG: dienelactone hydrolase family protein [Pseudomonadota bacterium]
MIFLAGTSSAQDPVYVGDVPLPDDAVVSSQMESAFSGVWVGQWDNQKNHILIVERLGDDGFADVIYAVGRDMNNVGRWFRRKARVEGNALVFADGGFPARYSLSETGRMRGVFADDKSFAILERQELPALLASPDDNWFSVGDLEFLETDLIEDGTPIKLATVVYRPRGDGPFPLAIIHHGSTGSGKFPTDFQWVWSHDWFADVLNANGWLVAFPQRRGRGQSDGLYDEGFAEDRSQGYSPKAALSLPGAERALTDANAALSALRLRADVDSGKALLGGQSRGGVVAILQAGHDPQDFAGVINFVGGWVGEGWADPEINPTLFRRIGSFSGPVLSIYGEEDSFYSVEHARSNVAEMEAVGADSQLHVVKLPGHGNGHWAMYRPPLWEAVVSEFLAKVE